ncbi:MAG: Hsp20/alpha crystallin family protein [Myxococcaceae bacterium]
MGTQVQKNESVAKNPEIQVREKQAVTREPGTWEGRYFEPRVDIYETADALTLMAEVPGVEAKDLQTDLKDNLLTISARVSPVEAKWKPLYEEYSVGHYLRQFRLGEQIDQSRISAQLKDGVLTLTLPKSAAAKPRRITVTAG